MKINLIVKLSIIFCITILQADENDQIVKKVIAYTKDQKTPSVEYIINTFEDKRLQIDKGVIKRFKNKPEKIKTYVVELFLGVFSSVDRRSQLFSNGLP